METGECKDKVENIGKYKNPSLLKHISQNNGAKMALKT